MATLNDGVCEECGEGFNIEASGFRVMCKPCQTRGAHHKQVESGYGFLVDVKLKPLIRLLNKHGYETVNSCQNQGRDLGYCTWVCFVNHDTVASLLRRIQHNNDELYYWLLENGDWTMNMADDDEREDTFSLRFPAKKLQWVVNQLRTVLQ